MGREARGSVTGAGGGPARARWTRHPKAAPRALPARLAPYFKHMYSRTSGGTFSRQAGRRRSMMGRLQAEGRRDECFCARGLAFVSVRLNFTRAERERRYEECTQALCPTVPPPSPLPARTCAQNTGMRKDRSHTHTHTALRPPPPTSLTPAGADTPPRVGLGLWGVPCAAHAPRPGPPLAHAATTPPHTPRSQCQRSTKPCPRGGWGQQPPKGGRGGVSPETKKEHGER